MHWVVVLFMHINRLSALNESNSASADLLVIEYVFSVAWCLLWLCVSLCFFFCALSSHRWEHSKNGSIFTIWKFSATRSTNVVRARAHNSLRIHLNLHNNPKCSAMSFCRFNYYCLNNFALLAGARATVCCYYYHWSLFSLQIVGRLCVSVYVWYTDNVTTHMNGKRRLMATKLNQMPLFFFHVVVVCLVNQPTLFAWIEKKIWRDRQEKKGEKEKNYEKSPSHCTYCIPWLGLISLHIVVRSQFVLV